MKKYIKIKTLKIATLILVIVILAGITIYLFPILKKLNTIEGQMKFKEKMNESGLIGLIILTGLQMAQIFIAILPGEPIEVLAGICFGTLWGTIFIMFSIFITTIFIYELVEKYGRKFIYEIFSKEKVDKIEKNKLMKNKKKIEIVMIILFLVPGTPKDLLVYIGGLLPIKKERFIIISTLLRFPSVISSTIAGDNLLEGRWKISIIAYITSFLITFIIVFTINKYDKYKITGEIINSIKNKEI